MPVNETLAQFIADARKLCEPVVVAIHESRVVTLTNADTGESQDIETGGGVTTQEHPAQQALSRALDMIEVMRPALEKCRVHNVGFQAVPFEIGNIASEALSQCEQIAGGKE